MLRRTLIGMTLCVAAMLVCYFWIDRPVAFFVYHYQINKFQVFCWLTYSPPELQTWSPLDIGSFPSGHAARILGFANGVVDRDTPQSSHGAVLCVAMLVSLVAMNYHFVSDGIARSVLGGIVATYATHLARLEIPSENIPNA